GKLPRNHPRRSLHAHPAPPRRSPRPRRPRGPVGRSRAAGSLGRRREEDGAPRRRRVNARGDPHRLPGRVHRPPRSRRQGAARPRRGHACREVRLAAGRGRPLLRRGLPAHRVGRLRAARRDRHQAARRHRPPEDRELAERQGRGDRDAQSLPRLRARCRLEDVRRRPREERLALRPGHVRPRGPDAPREPHPRAPRPVDRLRPDERRRAPLVRQAGRLGTLPSAPPPLPRSIRSGGRGARTGERKVARRRLAQAPQPEARGNVGITGMARARRKARKERVRGLADQTNGFLREYTAGMSTRELRRLFERDAAKAYDVLTRGHEESKASGRGLHRLINGARLAFLGLSYKLTPARRALFALSLLAAVLSRTDFRFNVGQRAVQLDLSSLWFVASILGLCLLLALELVDRIQFRDELEVARDLQASLLPREMPNVSGYRFAHSYRTAQEVGGDYYDVCAL